MDGIDSGGPDEGLRIFIPGIEECGNCSLKIGNAQERSAFDGFVIEVTEPPLDKIHPTGAGGHEMRHKPRMTFQPLSHFLMLVSTVVVHDQMERNGAGKLSIEPA